MYRDKIVVIASAIVCLLALNTQTWSQDQSLQSKSSIEVSLVTAESWSGILPLYALKPFAQVGGMMALIKAPNVPDDVLTGKTEFNNDRVGMVVPPANYVSLVAKLSITVRLKTSLKSSELIIVDALKKTHSGILWDDGFNAWVCSDAEYEPGQYEEYVIFILPLTAIQGEKELWIGDQKFASLKDVSKRLAPPQASAMAITGRIIKRAQLGDMVIIQGGKLIKVGKSVNPEGVVTGVFTIIEPKKD